MAEWAVTCTDERYDIIAALGVLYAQVDYYSILEAMAARAREVIVIESSFDEDKFGKDFMGVTFRYGQSITLADKHASLRGRGARISPRGYIFLMEGLGWRCPLGVLPSVWKHISIEQTDAQKIRFMMRFEPAPSRQEDLAYEISHGKRGEIKEWGI